MKYFIIILIVINIINDNYSQELIKNGGFEFWEPLAPNNPPTLDNPPCPKDHGGFGKNLPYGWSRFWLGDRFQNLDNNSENPIIFDSRWDCNDPVFLNYVGTANDVCGSGVLTYGDIGIPNNFFGTQEHRLPIDGYNVIGRYAGLFTSFGTNHIIKQELTDIECGATYLLKYYAVNKGGNNTTAHVRFSETGNWNNPIPYNIDGDIDYDVEVTETTDWQEITGEFNFDNVSSNTVWIMIGISNNSFQQGRLLLDDISLEKLPCDSDKPCSSTVGCPETLDVVEVLDNVIISTSNNPANDQTTFVIKNLEGVNRLQVEIYSNGSLVRYYNVINPPYTWVWDGVNLNGSPFITGFYTYKVKVDNSCATREIYGGSFKQYANAFNVYAASTPAGLTFFNLNNVKNMILTLKNSNNQTILTKTIINPNNTIAWDGYTLNGGFVAPTNVFWILEVSNECSEATFSGNYSHISAPPIHYLHEMSSQVSKPLYDCISNDFSFYNQSYDRAPIPCCPYEPDIYIDNTNIWYDTEYKALNNIYIGSNVTVVGNNSGVLFQAGNSITISPGALIADATLLELTPCLGKSTSNAFDDDYSSNDNYIKDKEKLTEIEDNSSLLSIFPNPTSSVLNIEVSEEFLGGALKIYDILGNQVWIETIKSNRFTVDNFANLSEGVYTILLSKDGYFETQKVVKQ